MTAQDNEKKVPQSMYHIPEKEEVDDCAQCFYQPGAKQETETEDCAQCFYQPPEKEKEDEKQDDCSQCFYQPNK